jgi:iron complex outermembrane recepter protein
MKLNSNAELRTIFSVLLVFVLLVLIEDVYASTLPVILISPEWRDIDLQLVPSTVNALSGEQLDVSGVENTRELQTVIPGLVFTSHAASGAVFLRGVGGNVSIADSARVATFVDGVYLPRPVQSMQELFDTRRVDVIKGPHNVLFGRNVVGGAVSIVTEDPRPYREAYADMLYGSYNRRQLRAAANLPIDDALSLRISGLLAKRDGYSRNIFLDKDVDDQDYHAWRGKLRYRPSDKLDIVFSVEQNRLDDTNGIAPQPDPDTGINGGIVLGGVVPADTRQVTYNIDQNQSIDSDLYNTRIVWETGGVEIESITAKQSTHQNGRLDLDATDIEFASNYPESNSETYSQEFRIISSQEDSMSWISGIYLSKEDTNALVDIRYPLAFIQNLSSSSTTNSTYAVFGQLEYPFTPKLSATTGLRYTHEATSIDIAQSLTDPLGLLGQAGTITERYLDERQWHALIPEISLSYRVDASSFYYGRISRGFKAGGFNTLSIQPSYDPEYVWAYEAGVKADIPSRSLRINTSIFYYDYSDMQVLTLPPNSQQDAIPIITNAAKSSIMGIDLQGRYRPLRKLEITAGVTLLDACYKEFNSVDPNNPASNPDHSGDPLPMAPDVSLQLGTNYRWPRYHHGALRLSANYKYQSAVYFNPYHDAAVRQQGYGLLNVSLGYTSYYDHWYAELYGNNLGDELYAQNIIRIDPVTGTLRYWGDPRSFGVRLGYKF